MTRVDKNSAPGANDIEIFLAAINFRLPEGFIEFCGETNGADITGDESYTNIWPLIEMIQMNKEYHVEEYAPGFFIFGSDGGDTAFVIEKQTGHIYEMPFIGMSKEEAVFRSSNFYDFLKNL